VSLEHRGEVSWLASSIFFLGSNNRHISGKWYSEGFTEAGRDIISKGFFWGGTLEVVSTGLGAVFVAAVLMLELVKAPTAVNPVATEVP